MRYIHQIWYINRPCLARNTFGIKYDFQYKKAQLTQREARDSLGI